MDFSSVNLMITHIILPTFFIFHLMLAKFQSKFEWLLQLFCTIFITLWIIISGRWDWFSYYIRFLWIVPLLIAIFISWKKAKRLPTRVKYNKGKIFSNVISFILIIAFGLYNVFSIKGYFTKDEAIELSFPLKDGTYYVAQGGNHVLINYHNG